MLRRLAAYAAWVAVLYGPSAVQAAPPASVPTTALPTAGITPSDRAPMPVRAALAAAWRQHPSAAVIDARLAAARARLAAAGRPVYNPEAEFALDDEGPDRTATAGLSLTLDLHDKRGARRDAAAARLTQAEARARVVKRDFVKQWLTAWSDATAARERVATGERRLAYVRRFADVARRQFAAQDISGLERDFAQLALDEAQAQQSTLVAELADAQARLRTAGGDPAVLATIGLPTDRLPVSVTPATGVVGQPDLQVAEAEALAAERDVVVAQRNRRGDPTVGLRVGRIDLDDGRSDTVAGVSVSVPLFVRNTYRAEVTAAEADAAAATAEARQMGLQLEADQQRALVGYTAARGAWTLWSTSRGTDIERRTGLLERLLREGELSPSDFLLQLRQTLDTQLAGAELEARVWRSWTDYLAATGQLERWAGMEGTP